MSEMIWVTGGCGFIGTNFVLNCPEEYNMIVIDKLTYAAHPCLQLKQNRPRHMIDLVEEDVATVGYAGFNPTYIIHMAAETHVDNSIGDAQPFLKTNVLGTYNMLELARKHMDTLKNFIYVSTDEVYGDTDFDSDKLFTVNDILNPSNPYAASKAAGEHMCASYRRTFGMPITITRCCNNFGFYQHAEKMIPVTVKNLVAGKPVPVYGEGRNIREWIPVKDHCDAILEIVKGVRHGSIVNIGSGWRMSNLELVQLIAELLEVPCRIEFVKDRKGHDRRYAIESNFWSCNYEYFRKKMKETVEFYREDRYGKNLERS